MRERIVKQEAASISPYVRDIAAHERRSRACWNLAATTHSHWTLCTEQEKVSSEISAQDPKVLSRNVFLLRSCGKLYKFQSLSVECVVLTEIPKCILSCWLVDAVCGRTHVPKEIVFSTWVVVCVCVAVAQAA